MENVRFDFFLVVNVREGRKREREPSRTGRARVHFPCTHTPLTIRRPLATSTWNAIPGGERDEAKWLEGKEDKVPGVETEGFGEKK